MMSELKVVEIAQSLQEISITLKELLAEYKKNHQPMIGWGSLTNSFVSPGIPAHAKPLPAILDIGKRVKITKGIWIGWEGIIKNHYIDSDDCSGWYGKHKYFIEKDNGEKFSYPVEDCELI